MLHSAILLTLLLAGSQAIADPFTLEIQPLDPVAPSCSSPQLSILLTNSADVPLVVVIPGGSSLPELPQPEFQWSVITGREFPTAHRPGRSVSNLCYEFGELMECEGFSSIPQHEQHILLNPGESLTFQDAPTVGRTGVFRVVLFYGPITFYPATPDFDSDSAHQLTTLADVSQVTVRSNEISFRAEP